MATAKDEHSLPSDHPDALESSGDHFLSPGAEDGPVVVQFGDSARPSSEALGIVAHTPSSSGSRPAHTPAGHMGSSSEESQYISTLEPSPQEEKKVSFTGAAAHAEASSTRGSDESKLLTKQSENGHILNTHQHKATLVQMSTEEQDSGTLHVESTRAMPTGPRLGHPEPSDSSSQRTSSSVSEGRLDTSERGQGSAYPHGETSPGYHRSLSQASKENSFCGPLEYEVQDHASSSLVISRDRYSSRHGLEQTYVSLEEDNQTLRTRWHYLREALKEWGLPIFEDAFHSFKIDLTKDLRKEMQDMIQNQTETLARMISNTGDQTQQAMSSTADQAHEVPELRRMLSDSVSKCASLEEKVKELSDEKTKLQSEIRKYEKLCRNIRDIFGIEPCHLPGEAVGGSPAAMSAGPLVVEESSGAGRSQFARVAGDQWQNKKNVQEFERAVAVQVDMSETAVSSVPYDPRCGYNSGILLGDYAAPCCQDLPKTEGSAATGSSSCVPRGIPAVVRFPYICLQALDTTLGKKLGLSREDLESPGNFLCMHPQFARLISLGSAALVPGYVPDTTTIDEGHLRLCIWDEEILSHPVIRNPNCTSSHRFVPVCHQATNETMKVRDWQGKPILSDIPTHFAPRLDIIATRLFHKYEMAMEEGKRLPEIDPETGIFTTTFSTVSERTRDLVRRLCVAMFMKHQR